jgi:hypothetical protein
MSVALRAPDLDGHRRLVLDETSAHFNFAVARMGFWSAVVAAMSSIAFTVGAGLGMFGVLAHPWDAPTALVPSIILARLWWLSL